MTPNKAVHLMFLSGGLLLFFILNATGEWIGDYFVRNPNEFLVNGIAAVSALVLGVFAYRSDRVYTLASDVAVELQKVTWPTRKEVEAATVVVIVTVIVASILFFFFDSLWAGLTGFIYRS